MTRPPLYYSITATISRSIAICTYVAAEPCATFPARFQEAAAKGGHDLVFVSQVFYTSAATSGPLERLAAAVPDGETFIVIDGYHGFMARPTDLSKVAGRVFYLAGGYKYAMAGRPTSNRAGNHRRANH